MLRRSTTRPWRMIVISSVACRISASLWLTSATARRSRAITSRKRGEQLLALGRGEHRRGLVEDEDGRVASEALDELDALTQAGREIADAPIRIDAEAVVLGGLDHLLTGAAAVEAGVVAEQHVLPHREGVDEAEVLVDHADAQIGRGLRVVDHVSRPASVIVPRSGWTSPIRIFISVDLPAPFSPRMPWIRPACRCRSTSSQATTRP